LGRLATEQDNLRSALAWALTHQPETALRLTAALHWFWFYRGHLSEGGDWTERTLASGAFAPPEVRVRALNESSAFARERADATTAAYRAEEAFALARSVGDRSGEGWARVNLGMIAAQRGDWQKAAALHTEAEAQFVSIGERHGAAEAIYHQALVAGLAGDGDHQRALLERSLAESQASGGAIQAAWILSSLGHDALEQGDLERARTSLEEALATAREFRFGMLEGNALLGLVEVAAQQGDVDLAATYLHDAEVTYRDMEYSLNLAYGLNEFGYLALDHGNAERAQTLFTEALGLARDFGDQAARTGFLHSLGDALRAQGDAGGAARQYQAGLLRAQGAHDARVVTECLSGIAGLATQFERYEVAARLFGAVETLRETVGPPGSPYAEERQAQDMAAVRDALRTEAGGGAWDTGRALPLDVAVSEALALAAEIVGDAAGIGLLHATGATS
jgi:tetratricopeptide (TPR) repeat protein